MERHLWLIGMMGSGKTATAGALGARWGVDVVDTDAEVATRTGCSIAQLWGERGEAAFREIESATIQRLKDRSPAVIGTGGGVVLDAANVVAMRTSGRVVWLGAEPAVLSARVGDGSKRPLLDVDSSEERLGEILRERTTLYAAAAHLVVDTTEITVEATVDRIEEWWNTS